MRRIILALSALLVFALLAPMPAMAQAAQSWIRVMHDSPDAPNVDVFVDGEPVFENGKPTGRLPGAVIRKGH